MKTQVKMVLILLLTAVILFVSHNVQALTITTDASYSVTDITTSPPTVVETASDPKSASSGEIMSTVYYDYNMGWWEVPIEYAGAYAHENGTLAVSTKFGIGYPYAFSFTAEATWSDTFTNPLTLTFHIPQVTLGIWDYCYCGTDTAGYLVNILLNGSVIWESSGELHGGLTLDPDYNITTSGTDIGLQKVSDPFYLAKYQSDPYSGALDIGPIAPGESFTIDYYMKVWTSGFDYEQGAEASIGDPFTLTGGTITVSGGPSAPIPEPSTLLLLGSGLTGIVWLRRKNR